ncbi:hypothetical protein MCOR02_009517 [Pyricularia oryzae]|uniref:Maltose/galactoside acetyltransferase domain-containing protein n=2 Tax=Pyricularia TaxID=48558 RepID=A0ABQ8NLN8_PYRGI|nr:hypothetical protein MCOR02_009517 [Pyricularia oryzae]KAI6298915.1 hypothetical protein MCOR33_005036 [Pyricularia grisea]KAH9429783.1 hypothetical protein MCOR02_009517 [Pyricularia oryzae]KAI6257596.1 hypothetical protein MCOR19_006002 [Pyricularia oryzae]KAI6257597.1 hypothetical protein MCOR19_006002 [Pyricularia oryzae]
MASRTPDGQPIDPVENRRRMAAGELYYSFTPELIADRQKCQVARDKYNEVSKEKVSRRELVQLLNELAGDLSPLPLVAATAENDDALFEEYPWIDGPITKMDYGYNVKFGKNVYVNSNSTWIDTCTITVGARTLIGPNCSFYSGTHPLDPRIRNGTRGPELGKPIVIEEDCWLGGGVTVLAGITIGKGSTVGAGSIVTRDVPPFSCVVGNPARLLKKIDISTEPSWS